MNKVAEVTLFFWIMKILATTLGETAGDFISMPLGLGYYVGFAITFSILAIILLFQIKANRYRPILYWTAIIATTTAGTEISDMMDRSFGLGYAAGSLILIAGLLATLAIWYYRDRNLSVYPITQNRRSHYYRQRYWGCDCFALHHRIKRHSAVLGCLYFHPPLWSNLWRFSHQTHYERRPSTTKRLRFNRHVINHGRRPLLFHATRKTQADCLTGAKENPTLIKRKRLLLLS